MEKQTTEASVIDISGMLKGREDRYGKFANHAIISQGLKQLMQLTPGWSRLTMDQSEALEMIQHKIARILNGDPTYDDNWVDIAGYATLVAEELKKSEN